MICIMSFFEGLALLIFRNIIFEDKVFKNIRKLIIISVISVGIYYVITKLLPINNPIILIIITSVLLYKILDKNAIDLSIEILISYIILAVSEFPSLLIARLGNDIILNISILSEFLIVGGVLIFLKKKGLLAKESI